MSVRVLSFSRDLNVLAHCLVYSLTAVVFQQLISNFCLLFLIACSDNDNAYN